MQVREARYSMDGWMDGWMDDFIYPDPSPKRYAGYNNYIYPCMYKYSVPLVSQTLKTPFVPNLAPDKQIFCTITCESNHHVTHV